MADSDWVVEVTAQNFDEQVVAQSRVRPVVVDFWAPWCGPCRRLGPVLEALAGERDGAFLLAKINSDENPQLAQAFGVEGIPAVYAIRDGKLVDHFTGLIPEDQLLAFLDRLTPSEAQKKAVNARELEGHDPTAAITAYRELLATNPDDPTARVCPTRLLLASPGNEAEARGLLSGIDFAELTTEAARLKMILALRDIPHSEADLAGARSAVAINAGDAEAQHKLGAILAARGEYIPALDALLAAAEIDRALGRGQVRELMLKLFDVIGSRSPEANDYRNRLRALLY